MHAQTQYRLSAADLEVVLAMARTGTLAAAGERLGVDASTVFRSLQRIERGLGQALFTRSRTGYLANELAQSLAERAEQVEAALEAARSAANMAPDPVAGTVRITTTDTILHGLVAPALMALHAQHPGLVYDLHVGNELASLTRRDADIAVRATRRPPPHLVGKQIGPVRVGLYAGRAVPSSTTPTWRPAARRGSAWMTRFPITLPWFGASAMFPRRCRRTASTAFRR